MVIRQGQTSGAPAAHRIGFGLAFMGLMMILSLGCEGSGNQRPGMILQEPIDPRCAPIGGPFPAGFALLPDEPDRAVALRFSPAALLRFDISTGPPIPDNLEGVPLFPLDSDGDGLEDTEAYAAADLCPPKKEPDDPDCVTPPIVGSVIAPYPQTALVTTSGYEQVLFYRTADSQLRSFELVAPSEGTPAADLSRPLYPPIGTRAHRSGLSTSVCVYPEVPTDSNGQSLPPATLCDPARPSFVTSYTEDVGVSGATLFVALSNYQGGSRYFPGTVLIHQVEQDELGIPIRITPDADTPVLFTTGFNPTSLTPHRTRSGRALMLVKWTGALEGPEILTDSGIDVIDVASRRLVATFPLGRAGANFEKLEIDPGGLIAISGAESSRQLYAVELAVLDDPDLYQIREEPVVLDGSTPGFPDARLFDADRPFEIPARPDGPPDMLCATRTAATFKDEGNRIYTTDWCDGSLSVIDIDWRLPLEQPLSPARFTISNRLDWFAPGFPSNFGLATAPSQPVIRPGQPGLDFEGPELLFLINESEGQLCAAYLGQEP